MRLRPTQCSSRHSVIGPLHQQHSRTGNKRRIRRLSRLKKRTRLPVSRQKAAQDRKDQAAKDKAAKDQADKKNK